MNQRPRSKKEWATPRATCCGSVKEITQATKDKTYGAGDDVIVDGDAILADVSS